MEIALTVAQKSCDIKSASPLCCNFENEVEVGIWHPKLIFWRCIVECLWRSRLRSQTERGCIVRNVLPLAVSVFHWVSVWKRCGAQWLMGFPHILSTGAFGALDRIDHVLEWVHVGCKALMVSFGWEWGSYSMGYVHVSASFKSIALAWPSSAWDMFAMRNFASNKVFCEAWAIWKVQRESLRTISLKWSSTSKDCSFRIFWTDSNLVWNVITECAVNGVLLYYVVVHFASVLQEAHLHFWSLSVEELPCLLNV